MIKQAEKTYAPLEVERQVQEFWNRAKVYAKTVAARSKGEDFYFGDGRRTRPARINSGKARTNSRKKPASAFRGCAGFAYDTSPGSSCQDFPSETRYKRCSSTR